MQATWLDNADTLSIDELQKHGIYYRQCPSGEAQWQPELDRVKKEKGYIEQDSVQISPQTPNLAELQRNFAGEHYHDEDEVRFVREGAGIFDIRSNEDRWIHIELTQGDLIVVPKKRYHRFFLTASNTIHCVRLFKDTEGWTPHYRDTPPS